MRDVLPDIDRWRAQNQPVALATVIQTWGSAPREVGAKMAMTAAGEIAGSVSGGCVEGATFEAGAQVLESGRPQLLHFGVADDTAWEVGLACGGTIEVFVEPLKNEWFTRLRESLAAERPAALATVVRGPDDLLGRKIFLAAEDAAPEGALGGGADAPARQAARAALRSGKSGRVPLSLPGGEAEIFAEVFLPSPTLVIVGGVHIAIALASLAKTLGYRTIVVDPRKSFGTETRFPHVDRLIQAWPDEALAEVGLNRSTAVALLTHDPKLDDPGLKVALPSPAFYVGALGSQKTQARRRERLLADGLTQAQLDRLRGPIGLDLGAHTPEEVALSVMGEVVAARNGRLEGVKSKQ